MGHNILLDLVIGAVILLFIRIFYIDVYRDR